MANDYYDQIAAVMREHGCSKIDGGEGSHETWRSPINDRTVTVPPSKSRHTANEVLEQLGIQRKI